MRQFVAGPLKSARAAPKENVTGESCTMRRTERVNVELRVVWNRAGRRLECSALDINAHGMFISTDQIVEHESLMHVSVQLPDHDLPMFVTARYIGRTAKGHGIGVEIFLIDDVSRSRWLHYYEQQLAAFNARTATPSAFALSAGP